VDLIARDDECDNINAGAIVFVEFPGTSSQRLVDDTQKLRQMKGHLLYAYEVNPDVAARAAQVDAAASASAATEGDAAVPRSGGGESRGAPSVTPAQSAPSTPKRRGGDGGEDSAPASSRSSPEPGARAARKEQEAAEDARRFTIPGHVFAVHRKVESLATHFLTLPNRHQIFGSPILVPVDKDCTNASLCAPPPPTHTHLPIYLSIAWCL
jgi:hypothetical protein